MQNALLIKTVPISTLNIWIVNLCSPLVSSPLWLKQRSVASLWLMWYAKISHCIAHIPTPEFSEWITCGRVVRPGRWREPTQHLFQSWVELIIRTFSRYECASFRVKNSPKFLKLLTNLRKCKFKASKVLPNTNAFMVKIRWSQITPWNGYVMNGFNRTSTNLSAYYQHVGYADCLPLTQYQNVKSSRFFVTEMETVINHHKFLVKS